MLDNELKMAVKKSYGQVARNAGSCCPPAKGESSTRSCGCSGSDAPQKIAQKVGYSQEDLEDAPTGANLGLGCGNPLAHATLEMGEIVLDLGSGAGFDCFLAARRVGDQGKVIGVDMTEEMIERAKDNARQGEYSNVEFRLGEVESLPVDDGSVDVIISNCVINLVPDKWQAFREAFRVLKPGGRLMVSDIVLEKELPKFITQSIKAYVGCVAGALHRDKYLEAIESAGFEDIEIVEQSDFPLDCITADPHGQAILDGLDSACEEAKKVEGCISSIKVRAFKPGR